MGFIFDAPKHISINLKKGHLWAYIGHFLTYLGHFWVYKKKFWVDRVKVPQYPLLAPKFCKNWQRTWAVGYYVKNRWKIMIIDFLSPLRGHNDMPFGRPQPRPTYRPPGGWPPSGRIWRLGYYWLVILSFYIVPLIMESTYSTLCKEPFNISYINKVHILDVHTKRFVADKVCTRETGCGGQSFWVWQSVLTLPYQRHFLP
jgi:hypothetical protein